MFDSSTIDRIVAGVLTQIGGDRGAAGESSIRSTTSRAEESAITAVTERVVTAEVLESLGVSRRPVVVSAKAIVTPAAWDAAKTLGLDIRRGAAPSTSGAIPPPRSTINHQPSTKHPSPAVQPLLIIVHHTDAVARVWEDLQGRWRRELLGCADDAAKLAVAELSRGGASQAVILAEQTHRAACLANRHERSKAVAIRDASDIAAVRRQLKANVWCLDPSGKSWFELRRLFTTLDPGP